MNATLAFQLFAYLIQHRKEIVDLILQIQDLFPDATGAEKAGVVRQFFGVALGVSDKIEEAWPLIAPVFNLFVAKAKNK